MCVCVYVCVPVYFLFEGEKGCLWMLYYFLLVPIIKHWLWYCWKCVLLSHWSSFSSILHKDTAFNTQASPGCWTEIRNSEFYFGMFTMKWFIMRNVNVGAATLKWKHCIQHIMDLNVSPCCRTSQPPPALPLYWAPWDEAECPQNDFIHSFSVTA